MQGVMIVHYDIIGIGDLEAVWCPFSTFFRRPVILKMTASEDDLTQGLF